MGDATQILSAIEQGDENAASKLLPLVYDELRDRWKATHSRRQPRDASISIVPPRLDLIQQLLNIARQVLGRPAQFDVCGAG